MSAGSGLAHSEKNASPTDDVNFLQIWVFPKERNIKPRYDQRLFSHDDRINSLQTVVSPEKGNGTLWINQDAGFHLGDLKKGASVRYLLNTPANGVYVFVLEGDVNIENETLNRRDGMGIWDTEEIAMAASSDAEILVMEVPMN